MFKLKTILLSIVGMLLMIAVGHYESDLLPVYKYPSKAVIVKTNSVEKVAILSIPSPEVVGNVITIKNVILHAANSSPPEISLTKSLTSEKSIQISDDKYRMRTELKVSV